VGLFAPHAAAAGTAKGTRMKATGGRQVTAPDVEVAEAAEGAGVHSPIAALTRETDGAAEPDFGAGVVVETDREGGDPESRRGIPAGGEGGVLREGEGGAEVAELVGPLGELAAGTSHLLLADRSRILDHLPEDAQTGTKSGIEVALDDRVQV